MENLLQTIPQEYVVLGLAGLSFFSLVFLMLMCRQLRKLNRNLSMVTGGIQDYFRIIMEETEEEEYEESEEKNAQTLGEDWKLTREEREMLLSEPRKRGAEEEALFHSVLK